MKTVFSTATILIFIFLLPFFLLSRQENRGQSIVLRHADSLQTYIRQSDSVSVTEFSGNVKLTHGDITLTSDMIRLFRDKPFVKLYDNVDIFRANKEHFRADSMIYFRDERRIIAWGNLKATFPDRGIFIEGDSLLYYMEQTKRRGRIWHYPEVILSENGGDTVHVTGEHIFIDRNRDIITAFVNSTITGNDFKTFSDSLTYFIDGDSIHLMGNRPIAVLQTDTVSGSLMRLYVREGDERSIDRAEVRKNVEIKSGDDSVYVYNVSGDFLDIFFREDTVNNVRNMVIWGDAKGNIDDFEMGREMFFSADSIDFVINESNEIDNIYLYRNALYESLDKETRKKDFMKAHILSLYFLDREVSKIEGYRQTVLGFNNQSDNRNYFNRVSGDSVFIHFSEGEAENLEFMGRIEGRLIVTERQKTN